MRENESERERERIWTREWKEAGVRGSVSFFVKTKAEKRKTRKLRKNERI